jgi:hypothetical protein
MSVSFVKVTATCETLECTKSGTNLISWTEWDTRRSRLLSDSRRMCNTHAADLRRALDRDSLVASYRCVSG